MPPLSSRLLVGIYLVAGLLITATLVTSSISQPQVATAGIPIPQSTQVATATFGTFPVSDDTRSTVPVKNPGAAATTPPTTSISTAKAASTPPTATASTPATTATTDTVNSETRSALVNIFCTPKNGGSISGSGIIVDNRGIILTNAHVAQFFLLQDALPAGNVTCIVRTGSPAQARYTAKLIYLPPAWISANATQIAQAHPTGTGENDYAFLQITGTTDGSPLPTGNFPHVGMTTDRPHKGDPVLLAAYPAGFLDSAIIKKDLYITSAFTTISDLFTFSDPKQVDMVSVSGTVVSQAGASGGSVVRQGDGSLLAIIVTATSGATTDTRDLRAITLAHIDRSLAEEGQGGVIPLLTGNLTQKINDFATNVAPDLAKKLIVALKK